MKLYVNTVSAIDYPGDYFFLKGLFICFSTDKNAQEDLISKSKPLGNVDWYNNIEISLLTKRNYIYFYFINGYKAWNNLKTKRLIQGPWKQRQLILFAEDIQ